MEHVVERWGIEQTGDMNWIGPLRADGKVAAVVCHIDREGLQPAVLRRHDANARMIAAAPDMLAALKLIESVYRQNVVVAGEPSSVLDAVQAAIAKAEPEGMH